MLTCSRCDRVKEHVIAREMAESTNIQPKHRSVLLRMSFGGKRYVELPRVYHTLESIIYPSSTHKYKQISPLILILRFIPIMDQSVDRCYGQVRQDCQAQIWYQMPRLGKPLHSRILQWALPISGIL